MKEKKENEMEGEEKKTVESKLLSITQRCGTSAPVRHQGVRDPG